MGTMKRKIQIGVSVFPGGGAGSVLSAGVGPFRTVGGTLDRDTQPGQHYPAHRTACLGNRTAYGGDFAGDGCGLFWLQKK